LLFQRGILKEDFHRFLTARGDLPFQRGILTEDSHHFLPAPAASSWQPGRGGRCIIIILLLKEDDDAAASILRPFRPPNVTSMAQLAERREKADETTCTP
jgi:hypothetical protein